MTPVEITRGDSPFVLGLPHTGTYVPDGIMAELNPRGRGLGDTDWHVERLYDGLLPGATPWPRRNPFRSAPLAPVPAMAPATWVP